jgi:AAA ATPase domain
MLSRTLSPTNSASRGLVLGTGRLRPQLARPVGARDDGAADGHASQAELAQVLAEAAEGRGELILIAGEAGVGKTRLAEEVLAGSDSLILLKERRAHRRRRAAVRPPPRLTIASLADRPPPAGGAEMSHFTWTPSRTPRMNAAKPPSCA